MIDIVETKQDKIIRRDGRFLIPEYTVPESHSAHPTVHDLFDRLNLQNSRRGVSEARFNALCSILVGVNDFQTEHYRFRLTQNRNEYGIQQWPIGYRPMKEVTDRLLQHGWLVKDLGSFKDRKTTVFEAPDNSPLIIDELFPVATLPWLEPVIQVKSDEKEKNGDYKSDNLDVAFHADPKNKKRIYGTLKPQMDYLNSLASQHSYDIEPFVFTQWVRKYRGGLDSSGGRLYAEYQQADKDQVRLHWRINGEGVAEVDITACGPTILACLENKHDLVRGVDPYNILVTKVDGMTRGLAKKICHVVIGNGEVSKTFPRSVTKDEKLKKLARKIRWKSVRQVIEQDLNYLLHPELKKKQSLWLQLHESGWLMRVLRRLLEEGVGCLPVHESVIVPRSKATRAKRVMIEEFRLLFGVEPLVDISVSS